MSLVFDLQDLGNASNTPATILFDGTVATSPASCTFAAVDGIELTGSIGSVRVTQTGSVWIVSTAPGGATQTRLVGIAGEGVDCQVSATGLVTFFAGRIPTAGELVTFRYRTRTRAIARLQDAASVAAEPAGGMPAPHAGSAKSSAHPPAAPPIPRQPHKPSSPSPSVALQPSPEATRRSIRAKTSGPATCSASRRTARR